MRQHFQSEKYLVDDRSNPFGLNRVNNIKKTHMAKSIHS